MYAGDKECREAFAILSSCEMVGTKAGLVDVRTAHEWQTIGIPDLSAQQLEVIFTEWKTSPSMVLNPLFAEAVHTQLDAQGIGKDAPVFFLCRSGVRSQGAASEMTAMGYKNAFNVLGGFEGVPNENGERCSINGWVYDGLPWKKE